MAKQKKSLPLSAYFVIVFLVGVVVGGLVIKNKTGATVLGSKNSTGFDEFGYNYQARIFNGRADGVDKNLDGQVWGDPLYANDQLVMKWSKAWDDARFNGAAWTCDAWEDNEWNGKAVGSGEIWHYKIVWVGPELEKSPCWREDGQPIWGEFEVVMSQGTVNNEHLMDVLTKRNGYGAFK